MEGIEFHDSYLNAVEVDAEALLMSAVVYRDLPNGDEETGEQLVRLTFGDMALVGEVEPLPFDIYREELRIRNDIFHELLPIPSYFEGPIELVLSCREDGREVRISGKSLRCEAAGEFATAT